MAKADEVPWQVERRGLSCPCFEGDDVVGFQPAGPWADCTPIYAGHIPFPDSPPLGRALGPLGGFALKTVAEGLDGVHGLTGM